MSEIERENHLCWYEAVGISVNKEHWTLATSYLLKTARFREAPAKDSFAKQGGDIEEREGRKSEPNLQFS